MDSKDDPNAEGHRHNTMTENSDTMALQKKRARRVSFAETTSIRIFNRDDESDETPLMKTANIRYDSPGDFVSLDGGNENDEDEEMDMRRTFLRPVGSPSPGGSTFGSASSNDEDNFFGPVSSNFINPARLSDSAASDDNHDLTMDSTAFSMHYRSLARSESGLDLKTPTGGQLFFDEKTPMSANIGSPMVFTLGKKAITTSCIPATEVSGSHNSNDMSLVGENPYKYDFDKLSPRSDALLAESRKGLLPDSVSDDIIMSSSPKPKEAKGLPSVDNGDNLANLSDHPLLDAARGDSPDVRYKGESADRINRAETNAIHEIFPSATPLEQFSYNSLGGAESGKDNDKPIKSPYQLSKNEHETPLASTSSPVRRQRFILTMASPSKPHELLSPLPQPDSMLRNGSVEHQEIETSIQKSISKLELLERSAFSSAFSAKSDNSFVKTLDFFKSPNFDPLLGKSRHVVKFNFVEDSATEEKLTSVHQSRQRSYAFSMDHAGSDILNPNSGENSLEEQLSLTMCGKSPNYLTDKNISRNQTNYAETVSTPSKISSSEKNLMHDLFTSKHSKEDTLMTESDSLLIEFASEDGGKAVPNSISSPHRSLGKKLPVSHDPQSPQTNDLYAQSPNILTRTYKYSNEDTLKTEPESLLLEFTSEDGGKAVSNSISSPHRSLGKKLPVSPDPQSPRASDLYAQSPLKQLSGLYKDTDSTPDKMFSVANLSNATANRDVESKEMKGELSSSPIVDVNSLNKLIEGQAIDNGENDISKSNEIFGTNNNLSTPSKEIKSQILHSKTMDVGNLVRRDMSRLEDNLPGRDPIANFNGSVSSSECENLVEPRLQNMVEHSTASPSRKKLYNEQSYEMLSPRTTRLEKISASKRNVDLLLRDTQHHNETTLMQRNSKLLKSGNCDQEKMLHPVKGGALIVRETKKWTDTYSKFSEDMKNLVSQSAEKLNSKMIDTLKDGLAHQQRSKVYELLHRVVMTENSVLHDVQLEKMAEANSLLHQVVFEKAKLQLNHVKKERFLKRLHQLNSRLQELQEWGENIASQTLRTCRTNVVTGAASNQKISVNLMKGHEVSHEKMTAMRQALDTLDKKILNIMKTFHARCKIKADQSCADTITLVNEHLLKRASCRSTRLEMQMWVVQSVGNLDGQGNVILNYLDFIIQSIKIIVGPASSVSSLFKLNEANILKSFPNMDACIAFAFVFNAETPHGYMGAKTLPQETQVTSSLLGTLLDVVGEVQLAQVELQNLTQSSFCSPSVERLDLKLCFFNYTSGRKVNLTLDMSCLKRGIYPSDVVPLQWGDSEQSLSSLPNIDVVKEAIKGVKAGYMRILRLCRCVAQVVRASTV